MKGRIAPRILAVSLFLALAMTPVIVQEGLVSFRASLGQPLLTFTAVLALLLGVSLGPLALTRAIARRRAESGEDSGADGEPQDGEGPAGEEEAAETGGEGQDEREVSLAESLSELEPENFMDLARALEEMGRDADTLEVLARVVEGRESEHGDEVAEALRRLRHKLGRENSGDA